MHLFRRPAAPVVLLNLGNFNSASVKPFRTARNSLSIAAAPAFEVKHDMSDRRQQACPLPAGMVSLVFGEVEHYVHLMHLNLNSCLCPCGLT